MDREIWKRMNNGNIKNKEIWGRSRDFIDSEMCVQMGRRAPFI